MFGYVRAVTAVLPPEEQARYRAVYCGLCKTLGERYGKAAQLTLNYDFVFLALLLAPPSRMASCSFHQTRITVASAAASRLSLIHI